MAHSACINALHEVLSKHIKLIIWQGNIGSKLAMMASIFLLKWHDSSRAALQQDNTVSVRHVLVQSEAPQCWCL